MNMNFHAPYFLFALIALGIPILIHLIDLVKPENRYFSNIEFLKFSISKQQSNNKINYWLILISRILAFFFIILAFAQPYFYDSLNKSTSTHSLSQIHIDNSMSMQQELHQSSGLDEAKKIAQDIIIQKSLNSKFQLSTQDFVTSDWQVLDKNKTLTSIGNIQYTNHSNSANQVLNRLQGMSNNQQREVFLISDFQKKQWNTIHDAIKKDSLTKYHLLPIETNSNFNVAIDSVWVDPVSAVPSQNQKIYYRIHSYGIGEKNIPISIVINGTQQGLQNIHLKNNQTNEGFFDVNNPSNFNQLTGEIRIDDSPVSFDNVFYFAIPPYTKSNVYLISEKQNTIISKLYANNSLFQFTHTTLKNINYTILEQSNLIVLENTSVSNHELLKTIHTTCKNKKIPLVIVPSTNVADAYMNELKFFDINASISTALLDTSKAKFQLKTPSKKQPFFKDVLLEEPNNNTYMPYAIPTVSVNSTYTTLLETINRLPFLIQIKNQNQLTYVFTCPFDLNYTNISQHNLLLPIFYKFVFEYKYGGHSIYKRINDKSLFEIIINETITDSKTPFQLKKGTKSWFVNGSVYNNKLSFELPNDLTEPGIYEFFYKEKVLTKLALNHSKFESDSEIYESSELSKLIEELKNADILNFSSNNAIESMKIHDEGKSLWKYCVILALLFLLIETLLLRIYNK